jgi:ribosomal protein L6P/L9E
MWYGFNNKFRKNIVLNRKKSLNNKSTQLAKNLNFKVQYNKQSFYVYKPFNWELIILLNLSTSQKILFFYSDIYFFKFSLPNLNNNIFFDNNTSVIKFGTFFINNNYRIFWKTMLLVFNMFTRPIFLKIKFKGKGYYIYKNKRNTITPQFNYAHRLYLYSYFISVKFLSKTSILLFGFLKSDIMRVAFGLKRMRSISIFTGRGVRFSRQIVYKKTGKVSSYR